MSSYGPHRRHLHGMFVIETKNIRLIQQITMVNVPCVEALGPLNWYHVVGFHGSDPKSYAAKALQRKRKDPPTEEEPLTSVTRRPTTPPAGSSATEPPAMTGASQQTPTREETVVAADGTPNRVSTFSVTTPASGHKGHSQWMLHHSQRRSSQWKVLHHHLLSNRLPRVINHLRKSKLNLLNTLQEKPPILASAEERGEQGIV